MKMKKCDNGHLYNSSKHEDCPYCDEKAIEKPKKKNKKGSSNSKSNTMSNTSDEVGKTMAYWSGEYGIDPVVGWIVCIEGSERGKDYKIRSEKNFIGRSEDMHITITGDKKISRRNHAVISYNPKERNFMIIPGGGTGIIYLDEEAVYGPMELSAYKVIEMGDSKFIFIPFCGQHFEWEN
ncbi:MAG: FHA domain-containing protein [Fusobacteriota bacterium]